jgi:hypothetical protein
MSKLLLLVQTEADVAHLDGAAKAILSSAITGVWLVFSPAITVNASEAASKLDGEIAQLRTAYQQAIDREDLDAAKGYKAQREEKQLDRAKALRDAWKTTPSEQRKARTKEIFNPFVARLQAKGISPKITAHQDHYDREQWVAMLNSLSGAWFKEFSAGGFVVGWPEAMEKVVFTILPERLELTTLDLERMAAPEKKELGSEPTPKSPQTREQELVALHPMKLGPVMRSMGLDPEGKSRTQKIQEILAAEAKPAALAPTPELAEY